MLAGGVPHSRPALHQPPGSNGPTRSQILPITQATGITPTALEDAMHEEEATTSQRRDRLLLSKVSQTDAVKIRAAAAARGLTVSTYLRDRALTDLNRP